MYALASAALTILASLKIADSLVDHADLQIRSRQGHGFLRSNISVRRINVHFLLTKNRPVSLQALIPDRQHLEHDMTEQPNTLTISRLNQVAYLRVHN